LLLEYSESVIMTQSNDFVSLKTIKNE